MTRQRRVSLNAGMLSSQLCQLELQPWMKSSGVPPPATGPVSSTLTRRPSSSYGRCSARQSTSIQAASSPSAYVSSAPGLQEPVAHRRGELCAW